MLRQAAALVLVLAGAAFGQDLHFKTRTFHSAPSSRIQVQAAGAHQIVEFDHSPNAADMNSLLVDGFQVVGFLPDNAVIVSSSGGNTAKPLLPRASVRWTGTFDPADKLSPELSADGPITAIVEFHKDIRSDTQDAIAANVGLTLTRTLALAANHAIVTASYAALRSLASQDEVAYIFPAEPALADPTLADPTLADPTLLRDSSLIACAGMLTVYGPVPQYANIIHGWDLDADHAAHLTYVFGSITPKVPQSVVESEIVRALNEWAKNANLIFQPGTNAGAPRTIAVKFVSGAHGDAYPFEGYGAILAHTFYPVPINPESIAGDMHLDADENWHSGADVDIYSVALHEAGHAIGLGHSDKPGDVMYPYYRRNMTLSARDIGAAQALYGPAVSAASEPVTSAPVTTPASASPVPPLQLTVDPVPSSTASQQVNITGVLSGGTAPWTVQWQTDHNASGAATIGNSNSWTASSIPLVSGTNAVSITVFDSAHHIVSQTITISNIQAPAVVSTPGGSPVSITIASPASAVVTTHASTISLAGAAAGGAGISRVTWQTSVGKTGVAAGTNRWIASDIPVLTGTTTIVVRAWDANGASAWAAVVAVK